MSFRARVGELVRTRFRFPDKAKTKAHGVVVRRDGGYVYVLMNRTRSEVEFYDCELEKVTK